jgi:uncharacterized protein
VKTIAVLGASANRTKFGNKCVRAYQSAGWEVFPVHPTECAIEGIESYARLADIPADLERISVYLPPARTLELLDDIAALTDKGAAREVWFNPGSADPQVVEEAERRGIPVRRGCSVVDIGLSPTQFP